MCDHPECSDDEHKTYSDEHDNELALCEAHYYYLVSGDRPSTLRPERTPEFDPGRPPAAAGGLVDDSVLDDSGTRQNPFSIDRRER